MWYVRDVLYAVLYVRVSFFVVRGCSVWRRYINVCNCVMFSVVNVYLDHHSVEQPCSRLYGCGDKWIAWILFLVCFIETPLIDQGCTVLFLGICFLDVTRINSMNLLKYNVYIRRLGFIFHICIIQNMFRNFHSKVLSCLSYKPLKMYTLILL